MMGSRPARLTVSALAWIALGAAFLTSLRTEQQIGARRTSLRAFETAAHDVVDALGDVQAGQQAYVSAGQDSRDWIPKVAMYLQTATSGITALRANRLSPAAGSSIADASAATASVREFDQRLRDRLASNEVRAAGELVYGDAADAVSRAVSNLEAAITAEQQAADQFEAGIRRTQMIALAGFAALAAVVIGMLGLASPESASDGATTIAPNAETAATEAGPSPAPPGEAAETVGVRFPPNSISARDQLRGVAELCTGFGRVREAEQLRPLLERAAELMNARGVIVWLGTPAGGDLRPVLAHGYSDATLARLSPVPRTADNAAAAAYRTGETKVVRSRPDFQGAIVAPLLTSDGCVGAVSAEIRGLGQEGSADTRDLAVIVAAQLAGVLVAAAQSEISTSEAEPHAAAG